MRSLYIHIPFCEQKCYYCDFCSFVVGENDIECYIKKLCAEIVKKGTGEPLKSVYIGGGTPSLLNNVQIVTILESTQKAFTINSECEISIECNPNSLTIDKLKAYKDGGINRISIGVQSLNDDILKAIGRVHTSLDVYKIADKIACYIPNFNFDVMIGLPNLTIEDLINTLEKLISFAPTHISMYSLILESGTPLYKRVKQKFVQLPNADYVVEQYDAGLKCLQSNGYDRYEISNFAKQGYQCKHNLQYWQCGEYYGVGLNAHSYIDGARYCNTDSLEEYLKGDFQPNYLEHLTQSEKIEECIMLAMRTACGLNTVNLKAQLGYDIIKEKSKEIDWLIKNKFIERQGDNLCICKDKFYVSNSIIEKLL